MMITDREKEMVADARMLAAELSKIHVRLAREGIEATILNYEGGRLEVSYEHITTVKL